MRQAAKRGIPMMCVASDAPDTVRVSVVSIDPDASAALVAELMGRFLRASGKVALVTGDLRIFDHRQKLDAYCKVSQDLFPKILLLPPIQAHDDHTRAYRLFSKLLTEYPDLAGVYVSTVNALPILNALENAGKLEKVVVIVTDLFPELVPYIEKSHIAATLYQRPRTQGQVVVRAMCRLLLEGTIPAPQIRLAPHLVMRGNLPFFLGQTPFETP
jgi:LacI family transcriptional regulator